MSKTLCFNGNDTLYVANLVKEHNKDGCDIKVEIQGKENSTGENIILELDTVTSIINFYVRTIIGKNHDKQTYSIGGPNATIENISAERILMRIPEEVYKIIKNKNKEIQIYQPHGIHEVSDLLSHPIVESNIDLFLSVVKNFPNKQTINQLLNLLAPKPKFPDHITSKITEAFCCLYAYCREQPEIAGRIIGALERFICFCFKKEYYKSIIYSVEAIGVIHNLPDSKKSIENISIFIAKHIDSWTDDTARSHLIWSTKVMLNATNIYPEEENIFLKTFNNTITP